jgi:predicted RND superfamily exporter protein
MANAIASTIVSVVGSSITTVAGFVALCFMSFTLGLDLGLVMAKGVIFGVIGCVTILPSMILVFDRAVEKTKHRPVMPDLGRIASWIVRHYKWFVAAFIIILIPAIYGYTHTDVYYDLAGTLPKDLPSIVANQKLEDSFDMNATHIYMIDSSMSTKDVVQLIDEVNSVDGVEATIGLEAILGAGFPKEMLPSDLLSVVQNDEYELLMISSAYAVASDEVNAQCDELQAILDKYDSKGMLIGEAPCTKDLINITNEDFKRVSAVSILAIFAIILVVFKSISLPIILVAVIEFAIFINMGIPAYTGSVLPFIASIVIGTIQLGATVDYAILMTNKYKLGRYNGLEKKEAITQALEGSIQSIIVSALSFFSATFGVGLYSNIDMISSLCILMSRGAIISMFVVIFILPSMFMIFDKAIVKSSVGFRNKNI